MASRNIYDPHGLQDFLLNATRATSIFDDDVVDVLANFFIQTPRYRNLLKKVCDTAHGGNIVQRCTQEALNNHGTLICTPIRAVELIVDLRMPRTRYPILQEFISDFRRSIVPQGPHSNDPSNRKSHKKGKKRHRNEEDEVVEKKSKKAKHAQDTAEELPGVFN